MKHLLTKTTVALTLLLGGQATHAQVINRSFTSNTLVAGSPDLFRVQNGLIAHDGNPANVVTGAGSQVGTFGATAKWIGIGAPVTPGNLLYGERTQWNEQAFIKALRQRSTTDVTKDAILEWGGGVASQAGSEMQFRHITNPLLPTGFTRILTMTTAGNSYFGLTPAIGTPKLGVTAINQFGFSSTTQNSYAGYFNTTNSIGSYFISSATQNNSFNRGVYAIANNNGFTGGFSAGVSGLAFGPTTNARYGVYGNAPVSPTSGFGNTNTSYAGFFQGDVYVTNQLFGSDGKYKINVKPETGALAKIMKANPVTYNFDTSKYKGFNFSSRLQHGFIAQEIATLFPEAVQNARLSVQDEDGNETISDVGLSLNYVNLISVLFRGIQEQQAQIDELKRAVGISGRTGMGATNATAVEPDGAASQRISTAAGEFTGADFKMEQNVPNPFNGSTVIRYKLPNGISNAFIGIYNLQGTQLLRFDRLNGNSQVSINARNLQPGIYIYSLVVEGQEVMSKRMIVGS